MPKKDLAPQKSDCVAKFNKIIPTGYVPKKLPCGKKINQHYVPGEKPEGCPSVCSLDDPLRMYTSIDACYNTYKTQERLAKLEEGGPSRYDW
jgi:hypothetical protein